MELTFQIIPPNSQFIVYMMALIETNSDADLYYRGYRMFIHISSPAQVGAADQQIQCCNLRRRGA